MATPSSTPGSPEDGAASVMAEWAPEADSLALTVGGDSSKQSAGAENELRVTDTIEFNFVVRPPLTAPLPPPEPIAGQLTAWTFGGLLLFLLGNGALLIRQFFPPSLAPSTPLEQLSSLPPWQEASLLSQASLAPETSLGLESLSAVPPPLPAKPKPSPPVAVAPRLSAPPPPPQSLPQPLAAQLLAPPAPVRIPAPPKPLPTLAVRPANLTPPPPPPTSPPPNPIEGNPPINLLQGPVTQETSPFAPPSLEQVRQQLQPELEPSPALSFNAQTRQRLLKMQNPAMANPASSSAPADITDMDRTQQLIQELESLNQAP